MKHCTVYICHDSLIQQSEIKFHTLELRWRKKEALELKSFLSYFLTMLSMPYIVEIHLVLSEKFNGKTKPSLKFHQELVGWIGEAFFRMKKKIAISFESEFLASLESPKTLILRSQLAGMWVTTV